MVHYVDNTPIKRDRNFVKMWELIDLKVMRKVESTSWSGGTLPGAICSRAQISPVRTSRTKFWKINILNNYTKSDGYLSAEFPIGNTSKSNDFVRI